MTAPALSLVLPVHEEAAILEDCVTRLDAGCAPLVPTHEILLMENGSHDDTLRVARKLAAERPHVRVFTDTRASYGQAMRAGLLESRGELCAVLNVDLWDLEFLAEAIGLLQQVDVVVGSKCHVDARDERPPARRLVTRLLNLWLRLGFAYPGTDTHGMKVFRRAALEPFFERCVTRDVLFDTELLLRAARRGVSIAELPVALREVRPARSSMLSRVVPTMLEARMLREALRGPPSVVPRLARPAEV